MGDKPSLAVRERTSSSPAWPPELNTHSEETEGKKQNCLCAPTTHAGSFRCRLHRKPPTSPFSSQLAAKRGASAQKMSSPKAKLALQHKTKQGCNSRKTSLSSCSSVSRLEQELPRLSRLSRTSVADDQNQSSSDQEASTMIWTAPDTPESRVGALESVEKVVPLDSNGEELSSSEDKRYIRPLVKLPSI